MKLRKYYASLLIAFILLIVGTITASAAKVGDAYTYYGVQIGYILIIIGVIIGLGAWAFSKKKKMPVKATVAVIGAFFIIGFLFAGIDAAVAPADITPAVIWSVTAAVSGGNITVDNDLNTVTILCHANDSTATNPSTMRGIDDKAFTQPVINFTIAPSLTVGITDLSKGATTMASVLNPDQAYTVDGTSYDLFADVSGTTGEKDLTWTADGTDEEESRQVTVQFGTSEYVELNPVYYQTGVAELTAGTIKSSAISIGGETWIVTLIVVVQNTA